MKRIFKTVHDRQERYELNLYVVGEEDEPDSEAEAPVARRRRGQPPARREEPEPVKVAYWPGCVSRGFTPELHGSMAKVAPLLDIELVELDRACCTGAGVIAEHNQELADTLNARTFALAQQVEGADLMMNICSTCQGAQSEAQERLDANTEYRDHVNETLAGEGLRYDKPITNKHFLWLMVEEIGLDKIASMVTAAAHRPARRAVLRLLHRAADRPAGHRRRAPARHVPPAAHRGAGRHGRRLRGAVQVLRVPHHHDAQGELAQAGGPPPRRRARRRGGLPRDARARCATSTSTSSSRWPRRSSGRPLGMPVLHLPQMVGLALGLDAKELGLNRHVVKPTAVMDWSTSVVGSVAAA